MSDGHYDRYQLNEPSYDGVASSIWDEEQVRDISTSEAIEMLNRLAELENREKHRRSLDAEMSYTRMGLGIDDEDDIAKEAGILFRESGYLKAALREAIDWMEGEAERGYLSGEDQKDDFLARLREVLK